MKKNQQKNSPTLIKNRIESSESDTETFYSSNQSIESCVLDNQLKHKGNVSFDRICVREHSACVGAHAFCSEGTPLGISWNYNEIGSFDVEGF